jgi:aminopeptidase YwaD
MEAIHNGADDNASGVAGIIEISEKFWTDDNMPKRTIVVVAFGAEEMGLIGSKYFVENPLIDLDKVVAMFNLDMIGRLNDEHSIAVGGTGTSFETEDILNSHLEDYDLKASFSKEGFGPSDHASFYAEDIPVFFITTGAHGDYHTPRDDTDAINFEGQKLVSDFSWALIMDVANRDSALIYQEAGSKSRPESRMRFKVTLGIVPDFTNTDVVGLGVGGVRSGGPAEKAGLQKGDVIVAMEGLEVGNIYDYMARLKKLEKGQIITVDVMRGEERKVFLVQL